MRIDRLAARQRVYEVGRSMSYEAGARVVRCVVCLFRDLCAAESGRSDGHPVAPRVSKRGGLIVSNGELYAMTLEQTVVVADHVASRYCWKRA